MRPYVYLFLLFFTTPVLAQSSLLDAGRNVIEHDGPNGGMIFRSPVGSELSNSEIAKGLKDALRVGTAKAVETVGHNGGYLNDHNIHIPLPGPLEKVKSGLTMIGAGEIAVDLETKINRAAEEASPQAAKIFGHAVERMSFQDAQGILTGPNNSATEYFKRTTTPELKKAMKPIVTKAMSRVGVIQSYNTFTSQVQSLPMAGAIDFDISDYVVTKTLEGLFFYVAQEEVSIRENPAARTTEALRRIFH